MLYSSPDGSGPMTGPVSPFIAEMKTVCMGYTHTSEVSPKY